ncbi:MAG: transporter substrate-binding domain-containing protein [Flavobacteriales bacterium]
MKPKLIFIFTFSIGLVVTSLFQSCKENQVESDFPNLPPPIEFDLDSIKKRGKIILLTENGPTTYYQYRGQTKGFDYEMVRAFAKHLGVKLEVRLLDDVDKMFTMLNRGEGDLIASNLTVTPIRQQFVAFGAPVYQTRQMLVQRKFDVENPDSAVSIIADTTQLANKHIWVHRFSSFYTRMKAIEANNDFDIQLHDAPGEISTEDLIRLTASGEIDATVTDENLAIMQHMDYPELDMSVPVSKSEDIAWAMRNNAPQLLEALNSWLSSTDAQKKLVKTKNKYFNEEKLFGYKGPYALPKISSTQISPYDSLFKKLAPELGWDWRLLAALAYQESRFNPNAESWSGAFGIMQLMPETAMRFGCDTTQREGENIRAGVKYIKHLDRFWKDKITNPEERKKFVLASYNIGPGHILDARNLAQLMGKSDTLWHDNVAECLLLKTQEKYYTMDVVKHGYCRASEPYHFVGKILAVYDHYKNSVK